MSRYINIIAVLIFSIFIEYCQCYYDGKDWGHPRHRQFSSSEECIRPCVKNEPPKTCYYYFYLEFYPTLNAACDRCTPNITQGLKNYPQCECIQADGVERVVYPVNRMIPGPQIQVCLNDYIVVDVENGAEGMEASLHWHGLFQKDYQYYDGVPFVTQCPIDSSTTFRYQFRAAESGTYFWHSHVAVHRLDGQYGSLIIRDAPEDEPLSELYNEDDPTHVILISDWMHQLATERFPGVRSGINGQTAQNILINGKGVFTFPNGTKTNIDPAIFYIEPGKRYRFRLINSFTTVCLAQFGIEDHPLLLIAQDGVNNRPISVDTIITGAGERVDFVVNANMSAKPYWIQVRGLGECSELGVNQLAVLQYRGGEQVEASEAPTYQNGLRRGVLYNPLDASCDPEGSATVCPSNLRPVATLDRLILQSRPDIHVSLPFWFHDFEQTNTIGQLFSANKSQYPEFFVVGDATILVSMIDDIIYDSPSAPPISEEEGHRKFCYGPDYCNRSAAPLPCKCTHVKHLPLNALVEIVVYDKKLLPWLSHPFHLHGTNFHVFDMGRFDDNRNITMEDMEPVIRKHRQRLLDREYVIPAQKDTILVPQGGWVIFRFIANNPGFWLFHCHFDWHSATGMQMIFHVGSMSDLPPVPQGFPTCGDFTPPIHPN